MKIVHRHPQNQTEEARRQKLLQLHRACVRLMRSCGRQQLPHREGLPPSEERRR